MRSPSSNNASRCVCRVLIRRWSMRLAFLPPFAWRERRTVVRASRTSTIPSGSTIVAVLTHAWAHLSSSLMRITSTCAMHLKILRACEAPTPLHPSVPLHQYVISPTRELRMKDQRRLMMRISNFLRTNNRNQTAKESRISKNLLFLASKWPKSPATTALRSFRRNLHLNWRANVRRTIFRSFPRSHVSARKTRWPWSSNAKKYF